MSLGWRNRMKQIYFIVRYYVYIGSHQTDRTYFLIISLLRFGIMTFGTLKKT